MGRFRIFLNNEDGAITADWLAIVAVSVGVTLAAIATISQGAVSFGNSLEGHVAEIKLGAAED